MSKAIYNAACGCGIRHPTKAVLKELAWFADDDGKNIWPSVTTLAERTGLSRRAVQKLLRDLEQTGAIDAEGSRLGGRVRGGRGRATRYRINLGWLEENAKTAKKGRPSFFGEDCGKNQKGELHGKETANGSADNSEHGSPEQKEHEYEKKQEQLSLKTGEPKAIPYEQQRFQQKTWKQSRRMVVGQRPTTRRMAVPSPPSARELEARRQLLRLQAESLRNRVLPEAQLMADSDSRLP
jgi:DNA-binding transcriptional ArsR family regulator